MNSVEIKAYEVFKSKFGEKDAELVMEYFDAKADTKFVERKDILATKADISEVKADIIKWMFIFWTGTVLTILGGLFAFLKLFLDK